MNNKILADNDNIFYQEAAVLKSYSGFQDHLKLDAPIKNYLKKLWQHKLGIADVQSEMKNNGFLEPRLEKAFLLYCSLVPGLYDQTAPRGTKLNAVGDENDKSLCVLNPKEFFEIFQRHGYARGVCASFATFFIAALRAAGVFSAADLFYVQIKESSSGSLYYGSYQHFGAGLRLGDQTYVFDLAKGVVSGSLSGFCCDQGSTAEIMHNPKYTFMSPKDYWLSTFSQRLEPESDKALFYDVVANLQTRDYLSSRSLACYLETDSRANAEPVLLEDVSKILGKEYSKFFSVDTWDPRFVISNEANDISLRQSEVFQALAEDDKKNILFLYNAAHEFSTSVYIRRMQAAYQLDNPESFHMLGLQYFDIAKDYFNFQKQNENKLSPEDIAYCNNKIEFWYAEAMQAMEKAYSLMDKFRKFEFKMRFLNNYFIVVLAGFNIAENNINAILQKIEQLLKNSFLAQYPMLYHYMSICLKKLGQEKEAEEVRRITEQKKQECIKDGKPTYLK